MPVSAPTSSSNGRTVKLCNKVRRAISVASPSIETPAFTRRTFDCESTSLLNGISREALSAIFSTLFVFTSVLVTSVTPQRAAERLSLGLPTRRDIPSRLSLFCPSRRPDAAQVPHHRAGHAVRFRDHGQRCMGKRMVRWTFRGHPDRDERPVDREPCDNAKMHHAAINHRQASSNAGVFDWLDFIATEAAALTEKKRCAPTTDGKVAAFGGKRLRNVGGIITFSQLPARP
jgi:hypothetical protein